MEFIWLAFVGGAAAFPHCLGMCGGFALHLAGPERRSVVLARQMFWHLGKTITYAFLGALAGFLGNAVSLAKWPAVRDVPGYVAGAIMVLMGLSVLGLIPTRRGKSGSGNGGWIFSSLFGQFLQKPSCLSALALGLANGLLPCPITIAFLGMAAGSASVLMGMAIMAAMGLGTVWTLLILGMSGHVIKMKWKRWGAVCVGVLLILMGSWTILRKAQVLPPLPGLKMPMKQAVAPGTAPFTASTGCHR